MLSAIPVSHLNEVFEREMSRPLILILSHLAFAFAGFALGIYTLPILMAPASPSTTDVAGLASRASPGIRFNAAFTVSEW